MESSESDPNVETVYIAAYKNFMEAIDAIDNGKGLQLCGRKSI